MSGSGAEAREPREGEIEQRVPAHGRGLLNRGGPPGGYPGIETGNLRRKARRHLAKALDYAARMVELGLAPRGEGQPEPTAAEIRNALEAARLLAAVGSPTAGELKREDHDEAEPLTIRVASSAPTPHPEPATRKSGNRVPSTDPNLPASSSSGLSGGNGSHRAREGGKGPPAEGKAGVGEAFRVVGRRREA